MASAAQQQAARERVGQLMGFSGLALVLIGIVLFAIGEQLPAMILVGFGVVELVMSRIFPRLGGGKVSMEERITDLDARYARGELTDEGYREEQARILGQG